MNVRQRSCFVRIGRLSFAALALSLGLASCTDLEKLLGLDDESGTDAFVPHTVKYASLASSPVRVRGSQLVYLAHEASSGALGTNLNAANGDLGFDDQIPVLINMSSGSGSVLRTAAQAVELLGSHVYIAVQEGSDSWDWNQNGVMTDFVLLHYPGSGGSPAAPNIEYVDDLDGGSPAPMVVAGNRLLYSRPTGAVVAGGETNLLWVDALQPTTPTTVLHNIATLAGQAARPRMVRAEEDLVLLTLSELFGFDLNGDGDANDASVLALLDATDPAALLLSTAFALGGPATPIRARETGANDWLVGFLVSEMGEGDFATGLNDASGLGFPAAWFPSNCQGFSDTDSFDHVLHLLEFAAWSADPVASPPRNTGLAGFGRVFAVAGFVATLVAESDEGGSCSSNGDADTNDTVLRWAGTANPLLPFTDENELLAAALVSGGSGGVGELGDRFVYVVDEAADSRNHDSDALTNSTLVAWLDPADGAAAQWTFDHDPKVGIQAVGATGLIETRARDRVAISMQEAVAAKSLNGADLDLNDSVPAFARLDSAVPPRLRFPYAPVAVSSTNAGIVIEGGYAFYRVDEAADDRDWTSANALNDDVLVFSNVANPGLSFVSALNLLGAPSVVTDGKVGAALLAQESMALRDFNGDGDTNDYVLRWFKFD